MCADEHACTGPKHACTPMSLRAQGRCMYPNEHACTRSMRACTPIEPACTGRMHACTPMSTRAQIDACVYADEHACTRSCTPAKRRAAAQRLRAFTMAPATVEDPEL